MFTRNVKFQVDIAGTQRESTNGEGAKMHCVTFTLLSGLFLMVIDVVNG